MITPSKILTITLHYTIPNTTTPLKQSTIAHIPKRSQLQQQNAETPQGSKERDGVVGGGKASLFYTL